MDSYGSIIPNNQSLLPYTPYTKTLAQPHTARADACPGAGAKGGGRGVCGGVGGRQYERREEEGRGNQKQRVTVVVVSGDELMSLVSEFKTIVAVSGVSLSLSLSLSLFLSLSLSV